MVHRTIELEKRLFKQGNEFLVINNSIEKWESLHQLNFFVILANTIVKGTQLALWQRTVPPLGYGRQEPQSLQDWCTCDNAKTSFNNFLTY
ncbi:hypothetical protein NPIL_50771 [Nephila pilipes]|uniref:Uncharacterized protein n=1 Tax=Nephila pilipes TaxID=299642 RepID=A0A8X6TWI6_NEPPI|nr:hypothetical protein NPIL_50771 [Nephila pilipes]